MKRLLIFPFLVLACGGDSDDMMTMDSSGGDAADQVARDEFAANVAPLLMAKCDSCHMTGNAGSPVFASDYESITQYSGMLSCSRPEQSLLISKGAHAGPAFDPTTEVPPISAWVNTWVGLADICMGADEASTGPNSVVTGANTIDLSTLGSGLTGATLTFTADKVGQDDLYLSLVTLNAGTGGLHVVAPLFEFCITMGAAPDLLNTFGAVDIMVDPDASMPLGNGTLAFPDAFGADLNVRFGTITPMAGAMGGPVNQGDACMASN